MYDVRYNASRGFSSRDGLGEEGSSHSVSAPTRYPDSFLACYFALHKNRDNNKITVYLTYLAFSFLSGCTRIITLVPEVFLDFSSRKREQATKRRQRVTKATRRKGKTPLVTLASNLTFMQTKAVKRVKLLIKRVTNGNLANTCLSAAIFLTGGRPGEIML